jgi:hypothetical protein
VGSVDTKENDHLCYLSWNSVLTPDVCRFFNVADFLSGGPVGARIQDMTFDQQVILFHTTWNNRASVSYHLYLSVVGPLYLCF